MVSGVQPKGRVQLGAKNRAGLVTLALYEAPRDELGLALLTLYERQRPEHEPTQTATEVC